MSSPDRRRPEPTWSGSISPGFEPVASAFARMLQDGRGGGALVVRSRGETVVDVWKGTADRAGRRPWTRDTLGLSFSTTKGVASTVIHRLAERGLLAYDEPVAAFWPQFGAAGKQRITVRELLSHRAGLHDVRAIAANAEAMLDHIAMEERLAARASEPGRERPGYHAITYGWLVAGLARSVTGQGMAQLARTEVAGPLGVDGLHIGMPADGAGAVAEPVGSALRHFTAAARVFAPLSARAGLTRAATNALYVPGFHRLFEGSPPRVLQTEMPAVNGAFTADGLARLYGALANAGSDGGGRLLAADTVERLGRVQTRENDIVLGLRMRWRLGYHHAFGTGRAAPQAFGHFGYGGSGGWADPQRGLSLGFVTNKLGSVSTPLGDYGLLRLNGLTQACARRAGRS
jgi:CubicO group peptidase (beta-lactamase class C family)